MKYLSEFRSPELVKELTEKIKATVKHDWTIMEICGGQTHSLVKNGLLELLPPQITMVHGPGCPVCVTPVSVIDEALWLAQQPNVILCSFGDMLRVPGSAKSLLELKSEGCDIRILYSPLEAVELARSNPTKEVVFFAVGFETTAPANALSVIHASQQGIKNYSILCSHVLVPPAIEALLSDPNNKINAFLAAGHVCTIMGMEEYFPLAQKFKTPIVITGFEPVDLLQGIYMAVLQLENKEYKVENQYTRFVQREGNVQAKNSLEQVFEPTNRMWRGIGEIPSSGYEVKSEYKNYNARVKFDIKISLAKENPNCISGDIMKGIKKPNQCSEFGKTCKPQHPLGAPMVSSEGACSAYYLYREMNN